MAWSSVIIRIASVVVLKARISTSFVSVASLLAFIQLLLSVSFVRALFVQFRETSGVFCLSASPCGRTILCSEHG